MGSTLTATIKLVGLDGQRSTPPLHLIEHFRSAWVQTRPDIATRAGATVLVSGSPRHQFAHGLLALLHENAPGLVAANDALVDLTVTGKRGLVSLALSLTDAGAVYTACAGLWTAQVIFSDRSSVCADDLALAAECGLGLSATVRETGVPA